MRKLNKDVVFGLYDDEVDLMHAIEEAREKEMNIYDVFTPFPVHGLDDVLGLKESRLHITGFIFGAIGMMVAFGFMTWVFTSDWPIIFGGKPYWSVPAFIPITFELTVLFASVGMVVVFYTICGMGPGVQNPILHERITDDKFCLAFEANGASEDTINGMHQFFEATKASEVHSKSI
ncbi:MAG: DUF3341 domain-containing protein [Bacteroidota bacterium]